MLYAGGLTRIVALAFGINDHHAFSIMMIRSFRHRVGRRTHCEMEKR